MDKNNKNNILMIHELTKLQLIYLKKEENIKRFKGWIFTFDDGLYSQWYKYKELLKLYPNNSFIFFISTNIINETSNIKIFIESQYAHDEFFKTGNTRSFMTIEHILEISNHKNCFIGGHGHNHLPADIKKLNKRLNKKLNLSKYFNIIKEDSDKMIDWFNNNNLNLNYYCYPYNITNDILECYLKNNIPNIKIFGPGRLDLNKILKE